MTPAPATAATQPIPGGTSRDRILSVATALFARHGYDGVSTRRIADAAGLNVATVAHHTGSKGALYLAVFERLHGIEGEIVAATLDSARPTTRRQARDACHRLLDAYVDVLLAEPAIAALWTRRWLEPRAEHELVQRRYVDPLLDRIDPLIQHAQPVPGDPVDSRTAATTALWVAYGQVVRATTWGGAQAHVTAGDADRLRALLHGLADHLLGGKPVP